MSEARPVIHLICNAHLDPVWLWEWSEGAAEAISTFRTAADLCEEFDGFTFNHNEAQLYQWIETYEPELFARIQKLVAEGRWHIMGGWYLQPDANMPSGESFVRQILLGHRYFTEKFGVWPRTAIGFDAFGHSRGLVQILRKSGQDSYLFCRPNQKFMQLEQSEFIWRGYDGSEVLALRVDEHYHSYLGKAREKVSECADRHVGKIDVVRHGLGTEGKGARPSINLRDPGHCLWGVGNHGGGPSRQDLRAIAELIGEREDVEIRHSTPEAYFDALRQKQVDLPVEERGLNLWAPGCYISQIRIKQGHRQLENQLYLAEKMASHASRQGRMKYPELQFQEAMKDLCFLEFHDILPGSSIEEVEAHGLRLIGHGLEEVSRIRNQAFFALASGQPKAKDGEIPILVYNPHPHPVDALITCEFNLADQNWEPSWTIPQVWRDGECLPSQLEKESSSLNLDWRKRVVFRAELAPSQMNRFDCRLDRVPEKPKPQGERSVEMIEFDGAAVQARINRRTGQPEFLRINGVEMAAEDLLRPEVLIDDADPWGMRVLGFDEREGQFDVIDAKRMEALCRSEGEPPPAVRMIEDGPVRSVVEVYLGYKDSRIVMRYELPKIGAEVGLQVRVFWNEKDRLLSLPLPLGKGEFEFLGQTAYGVEKLRAERGIESVAQQWVMACSSGKAISVINDGTYSVGCEPNRLNLRLLRSPVYAAHPIDGRELVPGDRFLPRIDQGERVFRFWLVAGEHDILRGQIDRLALEHNQAPLALSFFPVGGGTPVLPGPRLEDEVIQMTAYKRSEDGEGWVVRLFNPTEERRTSHFIPMDGEAPVPLRFDRFEIKSLRTFGPAQEWREVDLMERESENQ